MLIIFLVPDSVGYAEIARGGRLVSILDGMCEHNFEGNGSFFSFKRMA